MSPRPIIMIPPETIDVIDKQGGFTRINMAGETMWRPKDMLRLTQGKLIEYEPCSRYRENDNVTQAKYGVPFFPYPIVIWFDNKTKARIN